MLGTAHKILWALLIYCLLAFLLPPLIGRPLAKGGDEPPSDSADAPERVVLVDSNADALSLRLWLIGGAESEIVLSTFDWRDDRSGREIMSALLLAAESGVAVKLLVDGWCFRNRLWLNANFRALCFEPNVETRIYNPVSLVRARRINYRLHDKYLLVDRGCYLLGGRNISDSFLGSAEGQNIDRDLLVLAEGGGEPPSMAALRRYFERVWVLRDCKPWRPRRKTRRLERARDSLCARGETISDRHPELCEPRDLYAESLPARSVRLLSNPIRARNKQPTLWRRLYALMNCGERVRVQTPYIIGDRAVYRELDALGKSSKLEIMTNSPITGANPFGCAEYLNCRRRIRRTGATVREWAGENSLHTKTVLIGGSLSLVGSFNFDMRSLYLDTELMLLVDSPELNAALSARFDEMVERSRLPSKFSIFLRLLLCQPLRLIILPARYLL